MFEKFRQRSLEPENLDKGSYTPEEYEGCLVELRRVNEWLGDANALRDSLLKEIGRRDLRSFSVLDVGAGSGELLRVTAKWARETNRQASLVGLELNERSAQAILDESTDFREISSVRASGFELPFSDKSFDYVIQSLTLHHFDDAGAVKILREMARVAKRWVLVSVPREPLWRGLNMARGAYWKDLGNTPGHVNHWSKRSFVALLSRYGTVVEARSPFPWTMLLVRLG